MTGNRSDARRPDPDALLKEVQKEEGRPGRLKVFLGYSPGVGKTYTMLEEAHVLKRRGDDVVAGVVETHGRDETSRLLIGLEVVPRVAAEHEGLVIEEMDLDAVLARRPAVVLVDELAHTNAPWCRHPKRYQDVEELLSAGVDVYTTVNVQHFESQNDVVAKVTGVRVRETVPDDVLARADEVQVVDVPLEELFERLREGKVYVPEQARAAMQNFFRRGNLVALREITLSVVAQKMGSELVDYMKARAIGGSWPTSGRLLVCLGPSPYASQLVRKAYALARNAHAAWHVVHVETPLLRGLGDVERNRLADAFNLAEQLGARTASVSATDVVTGIVQFARENNITQLVIGRPQRSFLLGALRRSPVHRLLADRRDFDVIVVSPTVADHPPGPRPTAPRGELHARRYLVTVLAVLAGTLFNLLLARLVEPIALYSVYLVITLAVALVLGTGPSLLASILAVLSFDFFFTEPQFTFAIRNPLVAVSAVVFFLTSIVVGQLARLARQQRQALKQRLEQVSLLDSMGKELLALPPVEQLIGGLPPRSGEWRDTIRVLRSTILDDLAQTTIRYLGRITLDPAFVFLAADRHLRLWARTDPDRELSVEELAVAEWAYKKGEPAGAGTGTLANVRLYFVPMKTQGGTAGVIGVRGDYSRLFPEQRHLLGAIANLASLAATRWIGD